jgi:Plasmid pRiA4b ORF-3-like protein
MSELLQLRIELKGIKPAIWRSVCVPSWITLTQLHQVIQIAFGWSDCHLYEFEIFGRHYSNYDSSGDYGDVPAKAGKARLGLCLLGSTSFHYTYDFGDDWVHKISVKKAIPFLDANFSPFCLGGARACPPDDCGGVGGYENMLAVLANPEDEEYSSMRDWLGGDFDPERFDPAIVDLRLLTLNFKKPSARTLATARLKASDSE